MRTDHDPLKKKVQRHRTRPRTIVIGKLSQDELRIGAFLYPERSYWRPTTRADCANVPRPCPYVSCKHHLYLDVNEGSGGIKLNFPDVPVDKLEHSCVLDLADEGGFTLEDCSRALNISRERVRQLESTGLEKVRKAVKR